MKNDIATLALLISKCAIRHPGLDRDRIFFGVTGFQLCRQMLGRGMDLVRHPSSQSSVDAIAVDVIRDGTEVTVSYVAAGNISEVSLPPIAPPERTDELWRTTCFELFMRGGDGLAYAEYNFSPSGQWAAYQFDSYRNGMRDLPVLTVPRVTIDVTSEKLMFEVSISTQACQNMRICFSVIIEEMDGRKSYWALAHPDGLPDFHHDACFAAMLPPIATA